MGLTAAALTYSPWGRRSGAHFNPAVTLTFFRLGKVARRDAAFYVGSQFVGGVAGIAAAAVLLYPWIANASVNYVATLPGPAGDGPAFAAEVSISFLLMMTILTVSNRPRLTRFTGVFAALLVASFIAFEAPLSGMSMKTCPYEEQRRKKETAMSSERHYDVIIIGTGAGGGTLLHRLAPTGRRILVLDRGGYVPREKDKWDSRAVNVTAKYHTKEVWKDKDGHPLHPHTNYYVGGNTKFYGAALFRLRDRDFGEIRHHGGVSPAWPISYRDLETYYTEAEHLYAVHGNRGEDPTEPGACGPYCHPAVSHEPRIQQLSDDFARQGLKPFHVPLGIRLDEADPRKSACIRCNTCDGFACLVHAKSDAQVTGVDPALTYPNVTLLTDAYVSRLQTTASGRAVTSVQVKHNGATEFFSADIVVVSCGAINSAALLLRSANDHHPNGLGNSSDTVGRHFMATSTRC